MSVRRSLGGLIAFLCLSVGAGSGASSMSLDEFERLDMLQKENFMTTVLHYFHSRYAENPATSHKAECMVDLYEPVVAGGEPRLMALIMRDMELARAESGRNPTVERVVETVVERECAPR